MWGALFPGAAPRVLVFIGVSFQGEVFTVAAEEAEFEVVLFFEGHGGNVVGEVATAIEFCFIAQHATAPDTEADDVLAAFFLVRSLSGGFVLGFELAGVALVEDGGMDGAVVIAAEEGKSILDFAEASPALFGVLMFIEHGFGEFDEFGSKEGGEVVGEALMAGLFGEVLGSFDELPGEGEGLLLAQPVLMAAVAPFGEVLGGDGAAIEVFEEDGFDVLEFMEPSEDFGGGFAIDEALVEFVADGFGEAGDFAGSGCIHRFFSLPQRHREHRGDCELRVAGCGLMVGCRMPDTGCRMPDGWLAVGTTIEIRLGLYFAAVSIFGRRSMIDGKQLRPTDVRASFTSAI